MHLINFGFFLQSIDYCLLSILYFNFYFNYLFSFFWLSLFSFYLSFGFDYLIFINYVHELFHSAWIKPFF